MSWADDVRKLDTRTNADTPEQVASAIAFGAQGKIARRVHQLHEFDPMLGHRGCRLGISFPKITEMQARAIFETAAQVQMERIEARHRLNFVGKTNLISASILLPPGSSTMRRCPRTAQNLPTFARCAALARWGRSAYVALQLDRLRESNYDRGSRHATLGFDRCGLRLLE